MLCMSVRICIFDIDIYAQLNWWSTNGDEFQNFATIEYQYLIYKQRRRKRKMCEKFKSKLNQYRVEQNGVKMHDKVLFVYIIID